MNISKALSLTYEPATGLVRVAVRRRRTRGPRRGRYLTALDRLPRENLRELCDLLHDYADRLDQKERSA